VEKQSIEVDSNVVGLITVVYVMAACQTTSTGLDDPDLQRAYA